MTPVFFALFALVGCTGPKEDTRTPESTPPGVDDCSDGTIGRREFEDGYIAGVCTRKAKCYGDPFERCRADMEDWRTSYNSDSCELVEAQYDAAFACSCLDAVAADTCETQGFIYACQLPWWECENTAD